MQSRRSARPLSHGELYSLCVQIRSVCTRARPAVCRLPRCGAPGRGSPAVGMPVLPAGVPGVDEVRVGEPDSVTGGDRRGLPVPGRVAGGPGIAGGEGAHDVTPGYPGAARCGPAAGIGAGSFRWIPGTPGIMSAMSATAMMIRPMRTIACSLPVPPG